MPSIPLLRLRCYTWVNSVANTCGYTAIYGYLYKGALPPKQSICVSASYNVLRPLVFSTGYEPGKRGTSGGSTRRAEFDNRKSDQAKVELSQWRSPSGKIEALESGRMNCVGDVWEMCGRCVGDKRYVGG